MLKERRFAGEDRYVGEGPTNRGPPEKVRRKRSSEEGPPEKVRRRREGPPEKVNRRREGPPKKRTRKKFNSWL